MTNPYFHIPNLRKLGLFNIDGINCQPKESSPTDTFGRLQEVSKSKDTMIGHWGISGIYSPKPLPTYPEGFPEEVIREFGEKAGRRVPRSKPYSGTDVIRDYGKGHVEAGVLTVYTSADSMFQIAAYESIVPSEELYRYCRIAREVLRGKRSVGRVIMHPLTGEYPNFMRTSGRHGFSMEPPAVTMLDQLNERGSDVTAVGKISDIFVGKGVTEATGTKSNAGKIERTLGYLQRDFSGPCFIDLANFDMLYGHRNGVDGYAKALAYFNEKLPELLAGLHDDDLLMITADHGCDSSTPSADRSKEYIPWAITGKQIKAGADLGTSPTSANTGATILEYSGVEPHITDKSSLNGILR